MPTAKSEVIRMRHMFDAAMKAIRFCSGKTRVDLTTNEQLTLALARLIEIFGKAATKVTEEVQQRYSDIPWIQRCESGYCEIPTRCN